MIARHDEHGNAALRDDAERFVRLVRDRRHNGWPIEHIAGVHDEIDFVGERRRERSRVVGEEVMTATPSAGARPDGQIEPEMGVREQQDPDVGRHPGIVGVPVFVREGLDELSDALFCLVGSLPVFEA